MASHDQPRVSSRVCGQLTSPFDGHADSIATMRRANTMSRMSRPSIALASDDLGVLREGNETDEDVLRRQLIQKDREVDQVCTSLNNLCVKIKDKLCTYSYKRVLTLSQRSSRNDRRMNRSKRARRSTRISSCSSKVPSEKTRDVWQSLRGTLTSHLLQRSALSQPFPRSRVKQREKLLERKLCELAGENWQVSALITTDSQLGRSSLPNSRL